MLASCVVEGTNIVAVTYGGPVRTDEMLDAREEVDAVVRRHGRARLLVVYAHFAPGRREPRAMWSDLRTARLLEGVDRVAVVADAEWIEAPARLGGLGRPLDVEGFRADRRAEALAWLRG
jgi:hypothetical protein